MQAMIPQHHLGEAMLLGYAAGALPVALAVVAATHLSMCASCRRRLRFAERIGDALLALEHEAPSPAGARDAMLARLDDPVPADPHAMQVEREAIHDPDALPAPLHPYFGRSLAKLRWRWMAPGMHCIRAPVDEGALLLMRIAPGRAMPMHSHRGSELTCVLRGAYDDKFGHFSAGDLADRDSDDRHRPVMAAGAPCIGVSGLEGRLRYESWFAQTLQTLSGL